MVALPQTRSNSWLSFHILNTFIFLAILRLTNFNFLTSQLVGFETEINATGGNAFNFINYLATGLIFFILFARLPAIRTKWSSLWPFLVLVSIYSISSLLGPFTNLSWFVYQLMFIAVALTLHIYTRKVSFQYSTHIKKGLNVFFWVIIGFVITVILRILSQVPLTYYFTEFNDSFVQSLDDWGIMKQRFGYMLGFLFAYSIYIVKHPWARLFVFLVILFAGFGIRSFIIGLFGSLILFNLRNPIRLAGLAIIGGVAFSYFLNHYFDNIIYDTRYYSYLNAVEIIKAFPMGVGLGGYPIYTEIYHSSIFAELYNVNAILDYVPTAPESDYVHLFSSLGLVLGSIHIFIQARILWFTHRFQKLLVPFEKCILFYFCFMTFYGLSEDSIFSINYWIFFGISSGIISAVLYRKKYCIR